MGKLRFIILMGSFLAALGVHACPVDRSEFLALAFLPSTFESERIFYWLDADQNGRFDADDARWIEKHSTHWYARIPNDQRERIEGILLNWEHRLDTPSPCLEPLLAMLGISGSAEGIEDGLSRNAKRERTLGGIWLTDDRVRYRVLVEGEERGFFQRLELRIPLEAVPSGLIDELIMDQIDQSMDQWKVTGQAPVFITPGHAELSKDGKDLLIVMPSPNPEVWTPYGETFVVECSNRSFELRVNAAGVTRCDREVQLDDFRRGKAAHNEYRERVRFEDQESRAQLARLDRAIENVRTSTGLSESTKEYWIGRYERERDEIRGRLRFHKKSRKEERKNPFIDYDAEIRSIQKAKDPVFPLPGATFSIESTNDSSSRLLLPSFNACSLEECMQALDRLKKLLARVEDALRDPSWSTAQKLAGQVKIRKIKDQIEQVKMEASYFKKMKKIYPQATIDDFCPDRKEIPRV